MIERDGVDDVELPQVVFVRRVVAVPRHDVERRMIEARRPELAAELRDQLEVAFAILIRGDRRQEVARVCESVRSDQSEVRQSQQRAAVLADVTARRLADLDGEFHTARNHRDLARPGLDDAKLRPKRQHSLLRNDEQLAVGVIEKAIGRGTIENIDVDVDRVVAANREQALLRHRPRIPPQLIRRDDELRRIALLRKRLVRHTRPDPIQPRAPVRRARRRERRAAQLLRVQPMRDALRRVLPSRQSAFDRLGCEFVPEAGKVVRHGC